MRFFKRKKTIYRENSIPLLDRWNLFECKWFSIKVHRLITSDDGCHHDHPWPFITFLLSGGYVEHVRRRVKVDVPFEDPGAHAIEYYTRVRSRFSILYRPADLAHKLEIHQPVWTLVITFKKVRQWGFYTPKGWVAWFRYNGRNSC
jgi:hypothetical protein